MKSIKFLCLIMIVCILASCFAGCGADTVVEGEAITLSQSQIEIAEGETHSIYADFYPLNADSTKIKWSSSNEDVATVSRGEIKAERAGTCKVYASDASGEITSVCDVVVCDNFLRVSADYDKEGAGYGSRNFATITEALAVACEESVIIVEEGEYDEYVNITKPATIKGQNAVITGAFVVGYVDDGGIDGKIAIDGLKFDIGGNTGLSQFAGVYIGNYCKDVDITNCKFVGDFDGGEPSGWADEDISVGVYSIPSGKHTAEDVDIEGCSFEGLHYGVMAMPYVASGDVEGCDFDTCGYALRLCGSHKMEIEDNNIVNSGFLQFGFAENLADMIEVENNVISNYPDYNIVEAGDGAIDAGFVLDLSKNSFGGVYPKDMTKEEFGVLAGKMVGREKDGKIVNIKLAGKGDLKKIYEGEE